jgi:hypothetical protein
MKEKAIEKRIGIKEGQKPYNCPNNIPFSSLFGCLLKLIIKGV